MGLYILLLKRVFVYKGCMKNKKGAKINILSKNYVLKNFNHVEILQIHTRLIPP